MSDVVVYNKNDVIIPLRHIVSVDEPYNEASFKGWYYENYHKLDGDEFVFCATRQERVEIVKLLENKPSLILPIKGKWYDMIGSGEKREEYREIKPYYTTRLQNIGLLNENGLPTGEKRAIILRNGYSATSRQMIVVVSLEIKQGNPAWGAEEGVEYYALKIK